MASPCSVYDHPDRAFSPSTRTCKHSRLGSDIQSVGTVEMRTNVRATSSPYLRFSSDRSTDSLDLNIQHPSEVSVFPRNVYTHHPFAGSVSAVIRPRDNTTHYSFSNAQEDGKERTSHPNWFSRFGYDRFPNEYGVGVQTRGYIEPPECHECDDMPHAMAPQRFYHDDRTKKPMTEFRRTLERYY